MPVLDMSLVWLRRTGRLLVPYYEAWATVAVVESSAPHGSFRTVGSRAAGTCAARAQVVVLTAHPPTLTAIFSPPLYNIDYPAAKRSRAKCKCVIGVRLFLCDLLHAKRGIGQSIYSRGTNYAG